MIQAVLNLSFFFPHNWDVHMIFGPWFGGVFHVWGDNLISSHKEERTEEDSMRNRMVEHGL